MDTNIGDTHSSRPRGEIKMNVFEHEETSLIIGAINGEIMPDDLINVAIALIEQANKLIQDQGDSMSDLLNQVIDHFKGQEALTPFEQNRQTNQNKCKPANPSANPHCDTCPQKSNCKYISKNKWNVYGPIHEDSFNFSPEDSIYDKMRKLEEELSKTPEGRDFLNKKFEIISNKYISIGPDNRAKKNPCTVLLACCSLNQLFAINIM